MTADIQEGDSVVFRQSDGDGGYLEHRGDVDIATPTMLTVDWDDGERTRTQREKLELESEAEWYDG